MQLQHLVSGGPFPEYATDKWCKTMMRIWCDPNSVATFIATWLRDCVSEDKVDKIEWGNGETPPTWDAVFDVN